jgi:uncharacterized membrane protein
MDRSRFFLCIALIALAEAAVFGITLVSGYDGPAELSFYVALLLMFVCRQRVKGVLWDERLERLDEQVALKTLRVALFLMLFFGAGFVVSGFLLQLERAVNDGFFLLSLSGGIILLYLIFWILAMKPYWNEGEDE